MIPARRLTLREQLTSLLLWWVPIYTIAMFISESFVSGGIAAIIALSCDALYIDLKDGR